MLLQLFRYNKVSLEVNCIGIASSDDGLLAVELNAAEQEIQAIWAHLVEYRRERNPQQTQLRLMLAPDSCEWIKVTPGTKYIIINYPNGGFILNMGFGRMEHRFLLGGDSETPSPWFHRLFTGQHPGRLGIPCLEVWLPVVWQGAVEHKLLTVPRSTYGRIAVWRVSSDRKCWRALMSKLLEEGKLEIGEV